MNPAPEMWSQKAFKSEKSNYLMEGRIGFKSDENRKEFFEAVKASIGAKNWKETYSFFGYGKSQFQNYQYGGLLLPRSLFENMLSKLEKSDEVYFQDCTISRPGNWGAIKGGKALYQKNPEEFKKRRLNGLKKLAELRFGGSNARQINSEQLLSKKLCEFVGTYIGDGYMDKGTGIGVVGDSRLDANYFEYLYKNVDYLFGIKGRLLKRKDKNAIYLKFNSINLSKMFISRFGFPNGSKTYTVTIPKEIMDSNEEFIFSAVRGIFDTDGCVFFDKRKQYAKPYPRITLQMVSKPLIEQLVNILSKHFTVFSRTDGKRTIYSIEIYGHKQLEKWMGLIGFSNERHLSKIRKELQAGIEPAAPS